MVKSTYPGQLFSIQMQPKGPSLLGIEVMEKRLQKGIKAGPFSLLDLSSRSLLILYLFSHALLLNLCYRLIRDPLIQLEILWNLILPDDKELFFRKLSLINGHLSTWFSPSLLTCKPFINNQHQHWRYQQQPIPLSFTGADGIFDSLLSEPCL